MKIESFEDLECYQASRVVRVKASEFAKGLPIQERYRLVDQIIRASRSSTAYIAEGYGRHRHQENLQYLRQARGSLYETLEHYHTAHDEGYLNAPSHEERKTEILTAIRILNGYIRYIQSCLKK
jgi:four helix bundle protein